MVDGGYYGGISSDVNYQSSGSGGSGFISGHEGCIAIKSISEIIPKVQTYTKIEDSYHYSGKIFTNTVLLDGNQDMPSYKKDGENMKGNDDNGHCRITLIE